MDELIFRSFQEPLSKADAGRLERWRDESMENEERYQRLRELWNWTAHAAPGPALGPLALPDPNTLISRADAGPAEMPRRSGRWAIPILFAAALLAGVGFSAGLLRSGPHPDLPRTASVPESVITTGSGELTTIDLGDGTSIRLGPSSTLRLGVDGNHRTAWLDGRAFFGIRANREHPFTVRTSNGEAVVFGTRFEIRSEQEEFRVLVLDGTVRVAGGGGEAELNGGEMSRSTQGLAPIRMAVEDVYEHLDWMGKTLVFQATPLRRAAMEFERVYGLPISVEDPRLAEVEVTVTLTDRSVEEVLLILCTITEAECAVREGRALFRPRTPTSIR
jgi:transmembrane sensor